MSDEKALKPDTPEEVRFPDHIFVIFGATGDLVERKLLPALCRLMRSGGRSVILGVARADTGDAEFRALALDAMKKAGIDDESLEDWCAEAMYYQGIGEGDAAAFEAVRRRIESIEADHGLGGDRVIYLALPPKAFASTIYGLGAAGLNVAPGWVRLVVEKPFGDDLESARGLNAQVHQYFTESQVYRIDHYLGKQTVQNLLVFRFSNALFESVWNRERIERVEITVAEKIGIEDRGHYYDGAGVVRDMIQNHLAQLMTLVAMEVPPAFTADAIRREKIKVLDSVRPLNVEGVVLGQYTAGRLGGEAVQSYRAEADVPSDSDTPTFAALRLSIDNWRWQGVPFFLRTGKRMATRCTRIVVRFRGAPVQLFESLVQDGRVDASPNELVITLQPDEGFDLLFDVKAPTESFKLVAQRLRFRYADAFGQLPDAYETLLIDIVTGDQTLFVHADEVEASWSLFAPLLADPPPVPVHPYWSGSWGPEATRSLLATWLDAPADDEDAAK